MPVALPRMLLPFPMPADVIFGLCEKDEDAGVVADTPSSDDDLEETGVADLSRKDAVDDSRSFDGIFDCECVDGE